MARSRRTAGGRLTAAQWGQVGWETNQFTEMYSYTASGLPTKKRVRVSREIGSQGNPTIGVADLEAGYTYDNKGKMLSVTYPSTQYIQQYPLAMITVPGVTYNYGYDAMSRLNRMTHVDPETSWTIEDVSSATYGSAGEALNLAWRGSTGTSYSEARSYNIRLQLTGLTVTGGGSTVVDLEYRYSLTANNGQATQMRRGTQEVTYQYDAVNRLISAATTGPEWGLSFSYDGFGNRTGQNVTKGSAPVMNLTYNPATNRIDTLHGVQYDASGNTIAMPGKTMSYDYEHRLTSVIMSSSTEYYQYAPSNKRIYLKKVTQTETTESVMFYGVNGNLIGAYGVCTGDYAGPKLFFCNGDAKPYFGRKVIRNVGDVEDRIGSSATAAYFPYGENTAYYATYRQDTDSGLYYADQRYYHSQWGRFTTPDPYKASASPTNPQSWNRYVYVEGDPVNRYDPKGLQSCPPGTDQVWNGDGWDCIVWDPACLTCYPQSPAGSNQPPDDNPYVRERNRAARYFETAFDLALQALRDPECQAIFLGADGKALKDPITNGALDPATVLHGLIPAGGPPRRYGTVDFAREGDFYGEMEGVDLKLSLSGPYYSTVKLTFNMEYWNMGLHGQNTATLLHELGHAINRLAAGVGSQNQIQELDALIPSRSFDNQKLVNDKCTSKLKL